MERRRSPLRESTYNVSRSGGLFQKKSQKIISRPANPTGVESGGDQGAALKGFHAVIPCFFSEHGQNTDNWPDLYRSVGFKGHPEKTIRGSVKPLILLPLDCGGNRMIALVAGEGFEPSTFGL